MNLNLSPDEMLRELEQEHVRKSTKKVDLYSSSKKSYLEREERLQKLRAKKENLEREIADLERKQSNSKKFLEGLLKNHKQN